VVGGCKGIDDDDNELEEEENELESGIRKIILDDCFSELFFCKESFDWINGVD
jgi:hypothetical protein